MGHIVSRIEIVALSYIRECLKHDFYSDISAVAKFATVQIEGEYQS